MQIVTRQQHSYFLGISFINNATFSQFIYFQFFRKKKYTQKLKISLNQKKTNQKYKRFAYKYFT